MGMTMPESSADGSDHHGDKREDLALVTGEVGDENAQADRDHRQRQHGQNYGADVRR